MQTLLTHEIDFGPFGCPSVPCGRGAEYDVDTSSTISTPRARPMFLSQVKA